jgi:hypothetical protein
MRNRRGRKEKLNNMSFNLAKTLWGLNQQGGPSVSDSVCKKKCQEVKLRAFAF